LEKAWTDAFLDKILSLLTASMPLAWRCRYNIPKITAFCDYYLEGSL